MRFSGQGFRIVAVITLSMSTAWACAQQAANPSESACLRTTIVSVPSRPTVSNGADTTQCGVLEAEYGFERQWPGGGAHRDDLSGGLRLGLTPTWISIGLPAISGTLWTKPERAPVSATPGLG